MAVKGRREHQRVTYRSIKEATGINMNTLTRLANNDADRVALDVIDRLCAYFDCEPGDLFVRDRG